ncbi:MAG: hypothetical protein ACRC4N_05005, partial [Gammaproteobacteria bacterium]
YRRIFMQKLQKYLLSVLLILGACTTAPSNREVSNQGGGRITLYDLIQQAKISLDLTLADETKVSYSGEITTTNLILTISGKAYSFIATEGNNTTSASYKGKDSAGKDITITLTQISAEGSTITISGAESTLNQATGTSTITSLFQQGLDETIIELQRYGANITTAIHYMRQITTNISGFRVTRQEHIYTDLNTRNQMLVIIVDRLETKDGYELNLAGTLLCSVFSQPNFQIEYIPNNTTTNNITYELKNEGFTDVFYSPTSTSTYREKKAYSLGGSGSWGSSGQHVSLPMLVKQKSSSLLTPGSLFSSSLSTQNSSKYVVRNMVASFVVHK